MLGGGGAAVAADCALIATNPVVTIKRPAITDQMEAAHLEGAELSQLLRAVGDDPLRALWFFLG